MNEEENEKNEERTGDLTPYFTGVGNPHPIDVEIERIRKILLSVGFDEIQVSHFLSAEEARSLTGDLYPAFRDSIFHLSWIRLEPVVPSSDVEKAIMKRFPNLDRAELWNMLDALDEDSSGEELLLDIQENLGLDFDDSIELMNMIPQMSAGSPVPSHLTIRSFMPTSWLSTIQATYDEGSEPIRLFTNAVAFRREPILDARHNRAYHVISLAIIDKGITLEICRRILDRLLDDMGIEDAKLVEKSYQFPYFQRGTELEVFGGDMELGTCGFVSEDTLRERGLDTKVFILDLGIERILMHKHGYPDIRTLFFPQFFKAWDLADEEIGNSIEYKRYPQTDYGKEIAKRIYRAYREHADEEKIGRVVAWKGALVRGEYGPSLVEGDDDRAAEGVPAEVVLKEAKKGMGIIGPAAFDEIYVHDGNIMSVPPPEIERMEESGGVRAKKNYAKAFSKLAGWKIEKALDRGHTVKKYEIVKSLEDANLRLDSKALYYILSRKKRIEVRGPAYLKFHFRILEE